MGTLELFIIAVGLSMDAFAVAITIGLSMYRMSYRRAVITGVFFGGFQSLMPTLGYLLAVQFKDYVVSIDHWIAFFLLSIIGIKMIREARLEDTGTKNTFNFSDMLLLSIATSIDALAVGVTLAFLTVNIIWAVLIIGATAFVFSFTGVKIGNVFGVRFKSRAVWLGGLILLLLGIKILFEHLGVISFW